MSIGIEYIPGEVWSYGEVSVCVCVYVVLSMILFKVTYYL